MAKKTCSPSELKRQEDYVRACEDRVDAAKAQVKEAKAEFDSAILRLRAMARGDDPDFDFAGDAASVGGG